MNKLQEKFYDMLLTHLSDENTRSNARIGAQICKTEILSFNSFLREKYTIEEVIETYLNQE